MFAEEYAALVRQRRTVRDFLPDEPIPEAVLDALLADARHAPSWSNTRPYVVAVACGEQTQRLLAAYLRAFDGALPLLHRRPGAILSALLFRRGYPDGDFRTWRRYPTELRERSVALGKALYRHLGIERGDRKARDAHNRRNCEFFGAPTVLFLFVHKKLLPFSAHDAGLMLQTLMLSAEANGVASCPLGVLATWRHPVDAEFTIPKGYQLVTGLALGYASAAPVNDFRADHPKIALVPSRPVEELSS